MIHNFEIELSDVDRGGAPDAARMHKASKAAPRVVVYTHKDPEKVKRRMERHTVATG